MKDSSKYLYTIFSKLEFGDEFIQNGIEHDKLAGNKALRLFDKAVVEFAPETEVVIDIEQTGHCND